MHVRVRPPAAVLYGALLAHTLVSAANDLFAKRSLTAIPALLIAQWRAVDAAEEALLESPAKS